jgi:predicted transcriptional regulator
LILEILEKSEGGEIYQSELVRKIGFSKSRVSEVLSSLEKDGLISKIPLGKNFRVVATKRSKETFSHNKKSRSVTKILRLGMIRASEYPFVLPFEKDLREKMGIMLRFQIYENGTDLSRDLSLLRLDLGIAPVLTHFVFYSIGSPIKMIAPAGSGGAAILAKKPRVHAADNFEVATTKLSTMELMLRSSINKGDIPRSSNIHYYRSPKRMIDAVLSGEVDGACIWEPYSTILQRKRGFKRLFEYEDESEDHVCCAIAAGNHIKLDVLYRIGRTFSGSVDKYRKNPEAYLAPYSNFMRFDQKLTEIASKEYGYPSELDYHKLARQFNSAGINVPLPSSVKDAVLPAG